MKPVGPRRGFTLTEVLVTVLLLALSIGLGFSMATHARGRWTVRGVAVRLLADIRWARQRARATGLYAGIGLPAGDLACQQYAVVEADPRSPWLLRIVRLVDWSQTGEQVFLLPWGPGADAEPPAVRDSQDVARVLEAWQQDVPGRYLAFGPSGVPRTRDLPQDGQGGLALALVAGARVSGTAANRVWSPAYTLALSHSGMVKIVQGVPGQEAASDDSPQPPPVSAFGDLPMDRNRANRPPVIVTPGSASGLEIQSDAMDPAVARSGSVYQEGRMLLAVRATDPDGDRLYASWGDRELAPSGPTPSPPTDTPTEMPTGAGSYTIRGLTPMSWDPQGNPEGGGAWIGTVEWTPPQGAAPGDWFALGVTVEDLKGQRVSRWITVQVGQRKGSVAYFTGGQIRVINSDGTVARSLGSGTYPQLSPDGLQVAFWDTSSTTEGLAVMNLDGSGCRMVREGTQPWDDICWSPDGSALAYTQDWTTTGRGNIVLTGLDGTPLGEVTDSRYPLVDSHMSWSPDGHWIAYAQVDLREAESYSGENQIFVVRVDKAPGGDYSFGAPVQLTQVPQRGVSVPRWSPSESRLELLMLPMNYVAGVLETGFFEWATYSFDPEHFPPATPLSLEKCTILPLNPDQTGYDNIGWYSAAWSPDSSLLITAGTGLAGSALYLIDPVGRSCTPLVTDGGTVQVNGICWSR